MFLHNSIIKKFVILALLMNTCILHSMKDKDNKKNNFVAKFVGFFKKKQKVPMRQNTPPSDNGIEQRSIARNNSNNNDVSFSGNNVSFIITDNNTTGSSITDPKNNSFILIEKCNDVNNQDILGRTPLHKAIIDENLEEIEELLVNKNASFIITDKKGYNPVQLAVAEEKQQVVKHLINKSIYLKQKDELMFIMLMQAVSFFACNKNMLNLLIKEGVSLETRSKLGRTPLMQVIIDGRSDKGLVWLIEHGANIEAVDNDLRTPVIHAAREGYQWALNTLLDYGANIFVLDSKRKRALDYAMQNNHTEVARYIWEYSFNNMLGSYKGYADLKLCYKK